jgi:putative ABC transport system permease protein
MFSNYFKTAWRHLVRSKTFSLLNIIGLGLGMACSLLIMLWVRDETNMNRSNVRSPNVYDVYERVFSNGRADGGPAAPGLLANELKRRVAGIRYATGYSYSSQERLFSVGEKSLNMMACYADSDFFKIFAYPLLAGDPRTALSGPDAMVISRRMATNFFGSPDDALGKIVRYNNATDFRVAAVFDDLPANVSDRFDCIMNWPSLLKEVGWLTDWMNRSPSTYIELEPGVNPAAVEARIKDFVTPYIGQYGAGNRIELGLQRYDEMYLHAVFKDGRPAGGRIEYVHLFTLVAVFILVIGCINFMNLATARSVRRAKEVGIRKTVGAARILLVFQFIGEAVLLTFFAFLLALLVAAALLPFFNQLTGKQIVIPWSSGGYWAVLVLLALFTGIFAGSYPALFLSSLNPVKVLKGGLRFGVRAVLLRQGLVIFQFVLSITLIISTIVVTRQIRFVQTANVGFDREDLIYVPFQGDLGRKYPLFKQELTGQPGIGAVTISTGAPSHITPHVYDLDWDGKDPATHIIAFHNGVGPEYLDMLHLKMLQGRWFSTAYPSDTSHINNPHLVINETLAKMIGYKNPIGRRLRYFTTICTIIGVVSDFSLTSLHDPQQPLVLYWGEDAGWGYTLIKTQPGKTRQAIGSIEKVYKEMVPMFPFRYYFADEEYQKLYESEVVVGKLADIFSFFAMFISCLGLLGLTILTAEQRRKEIGIRKVIGASVGQIVAMLSGDIVLLVLLAAVVASPVAWLVMHGWLQNFAYRIDISWWIFLAATVIAISVALLTIGWQAIKAARANPVKSLRSE